MIGQSGQSIDVEMVAIGMTVLALDLNDDTDADMGDVRGGLVTAIETAVDPDTGEVMRRFVVAKQYRGQVRWGSLRADEVRQILPYDSAAIRRLIRALAAVVAGHKGVLVTDDMDAIDAMGRLARAA